MFQVEMNNKAYVLYGSPEKLLLYYMEHIHSEKYQKNIFKK